jgi:hypothetical protein
MFVDTARAGVVFGNMGASTEEPLDTGFNFNVGLSGTATNVLAQGFTTGTSPGYLEIQSVILGFGAPANNPSPVVQLMAASSGTNPSGTVLGTFAGPTLTTTDKYTYSLPAAITLDPLTSYFVVVSDENAGSGSNFNWYLQDGDESPVGLNSSGYSYYATRKSTNGGTSWVSGGIVGAGTSISLIAVPEPPALLLSGIGVAAAIFGMQRRRG